MVTRLLFGVEKIMAGKVGKFTVEFDVKGLKNLTGLSKKLQDLH